MGPASFISIRGSWVMGLGAASLVLATTLDSRGATAPRATLGGTPARGIQSPPPGREEPQASGAIQGDPIFEGRALRRVLSMSPLPPVPEDPTNRWADDERAARLGQELFYDPGLSGNGEVSCASCHDPLRAFADGAPKSRGIAESKRHAPGLLDVAHQRWFFWDGRTDTLWAQAAQPLEDPLEMGGHRTDIVRHLVRTPHLREAYTSIFGPPPDFRDTERFPEGARPRTPGAATDLDPAHGRWSAMDPADRTEVNRVFVHLLKCLAAYQRRLRSTPSPFDRFVEALRSESPRLPSDFGPAAQRGLALFIGKANCRSCHGGALLSDGEFHDLGLPTPDGRAPKDPGRLEGLRRLMADPLGASGVHSDDPDGKIAGRRARLVERAELWGQFRTPTLRNVARTAPYMHTGQMADLATVLHFYNTLEGAVVAGHHGEQVLVALRLKESELKDLLAFLESLSGGDPDPEWLGPPD